MVRKKGAVTGGCLGALTLVLVGAWTPSANATDGGAATHGGHAAAVPDAGVPVALHEPEAALVAAVRSGMQALPQREVARVSASAIGNVVVLTGAVPAESTRRAVRSAAEGTPGVSHVVDQLQVDPALFDAATVPRR